MKRNSNSNAIYNRNWLSYRLMRMIFSLWHIFFKKAEQHQIWRNVSKILNTGKNGYEAEAHFLQIVVTVNFFIGAVITLLAGAIIISVMIITGEAYIPVMYILYVGLIPGALMFVHTWKSANLEIIKARKIPYRVKSGYFTEVRNSDLIPSVIMFIIVTTATVITYWG